MSFFDFKDEMKTNPSIHITRELWATPHYYIYWSPSRKAFMEHFGTIDKEWGAESFIDDLSATDWRKV